MFPSRIDRIVLDENLDQLDYEAGCGRNSLLDAEQTFSVFQEERLANERNCALAQYVNATKIEQVLDPINLFLQS